MQDYHKTLGLKFLSNDLESWLWFLGILLVGFLLKKLLSVLVSKIVYWLLKHETRTVSLTEFINLLRKPIEFLISLSIISLAIEEIDISSKLKIIPLGKIRLSNFVESAMDVLFILSITWIIIRIVKFTALVYKQKAEETESKIDDHLIPFVRDISISLVVFASFFCILGFVFKRDVVSLITGLGVGGVALALAARETLENFFASFTLFTDQSFIVGDDIEIGNLVGKVEKIGFRSTKLRNVDGSFITIPNKMLISQVLNNLSKRDFRRVKQLIHLRLDSALDQVKLALEHIKILIEKHPETTNTQSNLVKLDAIGEYSLTILVVYYAKTNDYNVAKNLKENINFEMLEVLKNHGIALAQPAISIFPTWDEQKQDADY